MNPPVVRRQVTPQATLALVRPYPREALKTALAVSVVLAAALIVGSNLVGLIVAFAALAAGGQSTAELFKTLARRRDIIQYGEPTDATVMEVEQTDQGVGPITVQRVVFVYDAGGEPVEGVALVMNARAAPGDAIRVLYTAAGAEPWPSLDNDKRSS
jgi:hypothetical protein